MPDCILGWALQFATQTEILVTLRGERCINGL